MVRDGGVTTPWLDVLILLFRSTARRAEISTGSGVERVSILPSRINGVGCYERVSL